MKTAILNRNLRKLHLWFGIGIGLQLGLWLISGLFMTIFPIDEVRGTHLRTADVQQNISWKEDLLPISTLLAAQNNQPHTISLKMIAGDPIYILESTGLKQVIDARTGAPRLPIDETLAKQIASQNYAGGGAVSETSFFKDNAPREYGGQGPVWRIDFSKPDMASFYVEAMTGDVKAVRTGLWRVFDFMWGLHIMDWTTRENFNSWWIKSVAGLAVFFFFTGLGLAILRLKTSHTRRRNSKRRA